MAVKDVDKKAVLSEKEIDDWFDKTLKDIVEKDRDIIEALS